MILRKAREITHSDAGSLYLMEEAADGTSRLRFALTQNDTVALSFTSATLALSHESIAGHVALVGQPLNLADAYAIPPSAPFHINRSFDDRTGYRTKSMLVIPMRTPKGETIGVLQLMNCKPEFETALASPGDIERLVRPFSSRHEKLVLSLASQAAVAVDNNRLYLSIQRLFDGFVRAAVTAIEARDPTTCGHSFRVADLTVALAHAVNRCDHGPYGSRVFTADEIMELRYAALLHDFGKVGVRERVLVKANKLYPGTLELIRQRAEIIRRGLALRCANEKLRLLGDGSSRLVEHAAALDEELERALAEIDRALDLIVAANEPSVLTRAVASTVDELAVRAFADHTGEQRTILTVEEARALTAARGSLTPEEYLEIQSHVPHTSHFLAQIPWSRALGRITQIASGHHEKLDGSGYPCGLKGSDLPVQSRMMAIADIYDALTASDRPYKKALVPETALEVLRTEQRQGKLDAALVDLFVEAKVYEVSSSDHVSPTDAPPRWSP
jgi:HD-GYP domain-containing protein (c-di-GMP phosphodiesterase class II)